MSVFYLETDFTMNANISINRKFRLFHYYY